MIIMMHIHIFITIIMYIVNVNFFLGLGKEFVHSHHHIDQRPTKASEGVVRQITEKNRAGRLREKKK